MAHATSRVQHAIIGPGWNSPDGDGSQIEGKTPGADISVHHNLYIHNDARIPRTGEKEGPGVELDFRNNVIFNWNDSKAGYSGAAEPSFNNFVNNYYIGGPGNSARATTSSAAATRSRASIRAATFSTSIATASPTAATPAGRASPETKRRLPRPMPCRTA